MFQIFSPLTLCLESCLLILLCYPSHQCTSKRARSIKIIGGGAVAVMVTVAKRYDLHYAWRAMGEAYRGARTISAPQGRGAIGYRVGPSGERLGLPKASKLDGESAQDRVTQAGASSRMTSRAAQRPRGRAA